MPALSTFGAMPPRARQPSLAEALIPTDASLDALRAAAAGCQACDLWRRGKVRLHKTPNAAEQAACRPWVEAELRSVQPSVLVCLGATAAT